MDPKHISRKRLARLMDYLQYLKSLPDSVENISATRVADALALGDVLVRKDLSKVSNGGRRKLGYPRSALIQDLEAVLDMNSSTGAIVVGADKLGQALLEYEGFDRAGLDVLAGFDPFAVPDATVSGKPVYPLEDMEHFCSRNCVSIGIITVPEAIAQQVCDRLVACGIGAIWNFSTAELITPPEILVHNENLVLSLIALRMQHKNRDLTGDICS